VYFGVFRTGESDTTPPIVTNVIANTTISMSEINWTATDNVAVIQCTFVLNTYNRNNPQLLVPITLPVTLLSNNQYRVNANGLYTHETYSFRITCVDDLPNATVVNGSFTTQTDQTPPPDVARFTAAGHTATNVRRIYERLYRQYRNISPGKHQLSASTIHRQALPAGAHAASAQ
jgi:hypothetical protein